MPFNIIYSIIILCGMALISFFGIAMFAIRNNNKRANIFIALFCIVTFLFLFQGFSINSMLYMHIPGITMLLDSVLFLIGPIVHISTHYAVIHPKRKMNILDSAHLIPFVFNFLFTLFTVITYQDDLNIYILNWLNSSLFQSGLILESLIKFFLYISLWWYILYNRRLINIHEQSKKELTNGETFYISLLRKLTSQLMYTLILWAMLILFMVFGFNYGHVYVFLYIKISVSTFLIGCRILMRAEVLYNAKPIRNVKKYFTSPLSRKDTKIYFERICRLMENEELYLDPDFDLLALAKKMGLPRNQLSQIINEKGGKTFYKFINFYRIQEVKKHLENPSQNDLNILNIAFYAGFNSKSTFNKAFKDLVGMPPSMYRKKKLLDQCFLHARPNFE